MQVEHKTEKGTVLFVKVPDDAVGYSLNMFDNIPHIQLRFDKLPYGDSIKISRKRLEYNPWQLMGLTSEVTEEQAKMIVHAHIEDNGNVYGYFDYPKSDTIKDTVLDSFKSLMQHLQVYEVNPYSHFTNPEDFDDDAVEHAQEMSKFVGKWIVLFKEN